VELRVVLQCRASLVQLGESGAQEGDALWRLGEKVELGAGVEAGRQLVGLQLLVILPNETVNNVYWRGFYAGCFLLRLILIQSNDGLEESINNTERNSFSQQIDKKLCQVFL
jgi:hypothetical protein